MLPFGFLSFWLEIQSYSSSIHRDGRMVNCILVSDLFIVGMQQRNGWRIITDHNESILILCNWIEGLDRNLLLRVSTLKIASSNRLVSWSGRMAWRTLTLCSFYYWNVMAEWQSRMCRLYSQSIDSLQSNRGFRWQHIAISAKLVGRIESWSRSQVFWGGWVACRTLLSAAFLIRIWLRNKRHKYAGYIWR